MKAKVKERLISYLIMAGSLSIAAVAVKGDLRTNLIVASGILVLHGIYSTVRRALKAKKEDDDPKQATRNMLLAMEGLKASVGSTLVTVVVILLFVAASLVMGGGLGLLSKVLFQWANVIAEAPSAPVIGMSGMFFFACAKYYKALSELV